MDPPAGEALVDVNNGDFMSDEDVVRLLVERNAKEPLPLIVKEHVDFSVLDPRDFNGNVWCLNLSDAQHQYENGIRMAKNGFWKTMGAFRIPTFTGIVVVKTLLVFYEGQPPSGERTRWVMHEYHLELNAEANASQAYNSLHRVFLQQDNMMNAEDQRVSLNACTSSDHLEARVTPNSKTVAASKLIIHLSKGQDEKIRKRSYIKITLSGRRFNRLKIPQICFQRHKVSRKLSHQFRFNVCELLGDILDAILHDLLTMKQKVIKGKNVIWRMEEKVANAQVQDLTAFSTSDKGRLIQQLVVRAAYNKRALRCITKYVDVLRKRSSARPTADRLYSQAQQLQEVNEPMKEFACILYELLRNLSSRTLEEDGWTVQFRAYLQSSFAKVCDVSSEVGQLEVQVLQLKNQVVETLLGDVSTSALHKMIDTLESVELCLHNASKKFRVIYAELHSSKGILNGKIRCFSRVAGHQQYMEKKCAEINPKLGEIRDEIEKILNMHHLSVETEGELDDPTQYEQETLDADEYAFRSFKERALDLCFSWRTRLFHNRPILPPVRVQSGATCSYYATLSTVESLYKREYAACPTIMKDDVGQPDEYLINLSRRQLEDIVEHFYATHKTKGTERLNICLEKMKNEGVGSEEAYNDPRVQPGRRYRIKGYEEINLQPDEVKVQKIREKPVSDRRRRRLLERRRREVLQNISEVIRSHLLEGKVLIANFMVTTEYYRLLPHQIYRVPKRNAKYEVTKKGKRISHCVVVVGYGVRDTENYLIYQNSYGKTWGDGGFGRIYLDSVSKLFLAKV